MLWLMAILISLPLLWQSKHAVLNMLCMYVCSVWLKPHFILIFYFVLRVNRTERPWEVRAKEMRKALADNLGLGTLVEKKQQEVV